MVSPARSRTSSPSLLIEPFALHSILVSGGPILQGKIVCVLASVLQADEYILVVFHDLAEDLEAIVKPDFLSDLTGLNLSKHFVVLSDVHDVVFLWKAVSSF